RGANCACELRASKCATAQRPCLKRRNTATAQRREQQPSASFHVRTPAATPCPATLRRYEAPFGVRRFASAVQNAPLSPCALIERPARSAGFRFLYPSRVGRASDTWPPISPIRSLSPSHHGSSPPTHPDPRTDRSRASHHA